MSVREGWGTSACVTTFHLAQLGALIIGSGGGYHTLTGTASADVTKLFQFMEREGVGGGVQQHRIIESEHYG